jgi:hypothetical protein
MAKVKATLVLTVHYEDESEKLSEPEAVEEAERLLKRLAELAVNRGLMSGDSPLTVDSYDSEVKASLKR